MRLCCSIGFFTLTFYLTFSPNFMTEKCVHFYFFPKKLRMLPCFLPTGGEIFFLVFVEVVAAGAVFFAVGSTAAGSGSSSEQLTSSISRTVSTIDEKGGMI